MPKATKEPLFSFQNVRTYHSWMNDEQHQVTPIAVTNWRDIRKKFGIKEKNRRGHMYLIGKTGTGKSNLLATMAISDIKQGNGIAVIDPHGDLVETLLKQVPKERLKDVIYFNPGDLNYPIGFNPLYNISPDQQHLVVSGLIAVFKKIWFEFWGPRLEHILRHSLLTLLEYPGATLLDIPRLLTEPEFRQEAVRHLTSIEVSRFWSHEFDKYNQWLRSEATAPILNKMGQFLTSLPLRNIVGQPESSFKLRSIMDEGKILLVNLSKGAIGEDNCMVLGSFLVAMIYLAATSRASVPIEKRRSFYLYVDEFHTFVSLSFADILSESRKYGLYLIFAHQYISQLHEKVRSAVFGNVGTIISFRIGAEDARYLATEFQPTFGVADFVNLPNFHIYLRLMINGVTSQPFSAVTLPVRIPENSFVEEIIRKSRLKYGVLRKDVEAKILMRYKRDYFIDVKEECDKTRQRKLL